MGVYIAAVTNAVVCKCVNYELLTWVMRLVGHYVMLIGWVLMCTTQSATLTYTSWSSRIFICIVGSNGVLLVPLHSSITWISSGSMHIFIQ